ncbi:MAG: putative ABC transporter permease [Oscillospiraceae bacterium]|nr:putative ABC transporter permease [Oscillospiraceae bacterium]
MKENYTLICRLAAEFTICCFCGWLYEVALYWMMYGYYQERGVLQLPLLPIYGFGGLALLALFRKRRNWAWVFFGSVLLTTALELVCSYLLEWIFGESLWDYSHWWLDFEGRISLPSSLIFGMMSLLLIKGLDPMMQKFQEKAPSWLVQGIGTLCMLTILGDAMWTFFVK